MAAETTPEINDAIGTVFENITARLTDLEAKVEEQSTLTVAFQREPVEGVLRTFEQAPSIGRIVHFRLNEQIPLDRPAIVTHVHDDEAGGVALHIFARLDDIPFAYGTAVKRSDTLGCYCDRALEGMALGQWHWPVIETSDVGTDEV